MTDPYEALEQLTIAQALGLQVVAEGIERVDQLAPLRALGCELGQGYLFARPMEADVLSGLLAHPVLVPEDAAGANVIVPMRSHRRGAKARESDRRQGVG